jgi:outer membrane protein TolC
MARFARQFGLLLPALALVLTLPGCRSPLPADRSVRAVIEDKARAALPLETNAVADAFALPPGPAGETRAMDLGLEDALRAATLHSRALQTRREQLILSGLATLAARREFGPQYSATLEYLFRQDTSERQRHSASASLNASQILPTGGTLSLAGALNAASTNAFGESGYAGSAALELRQPVLAGAGYAVSHERAIQAERDLVYALRAFARERQDFALRIVRGYYTVLVQKAVLENTRFTVEQSAFLRRRSEALFRIRHAPALDVMRAQQQELAASNSLSVAETQYEVEVNRYLIELGLPPETRLRVTGAVPEIRSVTLDEASSIAGALRHRPDIQTVRDRVEDAGRALRVARNALLPRADAYAKIGLSAGEVGSLSDLEYDDDWSGGVTVDLPFDPRSERDAVRRAHVALSAARRALEEQEDTVRVEIMEAYRGLQAQRRSAEIALRNTALAERRSEYAVLRFKQGELSNRDVVEAQNELLSARNAYVQARVAYAMQRLGLLRDVGRLDVAPDGCLIERNAAEEPTASAAPRPPRKGSP